MALNLDAFKKRLTDDKNRLQTQLQKDSSAYASENENVWKPTVDKDGNGTALIRFLYNPEKSQNFYEEVRNHGFKEGGKWYIENCPKTLNWDNPCPACDYAQKLIDGRDWKTIPAAEQSKIRNYFSSVSYWTNIYVIKDPNNPQAEGKVWKYRFGKKIKAKIEEALREDPLEGTPGFSAFDPFNGADFKLIIKTVGGYMNYDDSRFSVPAPFLGGDDNAILDVLENQLHDLSYISAKESFKPHDELKKRFAAIVKGAAEDEDDWGEEEEEEVVVKPTPKPKKAAATPKKPVEEKVEEEEEATEEKDDGGSGDIDDDYFRKLVDDI